MHAEAEAGQPPAVLKVQVSIADLARGLGVGLAEGVTVNVGLTEPVGVEVSVGEGVFDGVGEGGMQETSVAEPAPPVSPIAPPPVGTLAPAEAPKAALM